MDIDDTALQLAASNAAEFEELELELVRADVFRLPGRLWADTVVCNPPFGTRTKGADTDFLRAASAIADTIYSLHKSTTREHIATVAKALGFEAAVLAELRFDIPSMYAFHREKSKDVAVDLWRLHRAAER